MLIKLNRLAGLVGRVSFVLLWAQSARLGPARCGSFGSFPRDDSKKKKQKRIKRNEKKHARTSTKRWNQIMFLCQFRSRRLTASSTQPNTNAFIARSPPHLVPFFTAFFFFGFECAISLAQENRLRTLLNWLIYFIFLLRLCRLPSTWLLLSLPFHFEFRNSMPDGNRQSCHIIIVASDECQSIFNEIQGASLREVNPRLVAGMRDSFREF